MNGNELFNDVQSFGSGDVFHYGEVGKEEINTLMKALQAQEGVTDISQLQGAGALQMQSLEGTLALLTFQEKHLKLYKDLGIQKAFSTLEEYSVQDGYGNGFDSGFVGQMENPEEQDAEMERKYAVIKYIRSMWRVSDVLQYTRVITNAEVINVQAAMMRVLRTTERQLFFGDSDKVPAAFDGIIPTVKNLASANVIDLRGATLTEYQLKLAAEMITANLGTPSKFYGSLSVVSTLNNILDSTKQRIVQNEVGGAFDLGHAISGMKTPYGNFPIEPDIFINPESQGVPTIKDPSNPGSFIEGATSTKAPATPSFTLTPVGATVSGSLWAGTGSGGAVAGAYQYRIVAINQYGKSMAAAAQSATVVASGSMSIAITSGGGANVATAYEIYRETIPGSGKIMYLTTVKRSTGATTTYVDLNAELSGTSQAVLIDNTTVGELRTIALSQLAPMHRVSYAKIGPYQWGTVNFYAVPKYYAPAKMIVFKNVGISALIRSPLIDL